MPAESTPPTTNGTMIENRAINAMAAKTFTTNLPVLPSPRFARGLTFSMADRTLWSTTFAKLSKFTDSPRICNFSTGVFAAGIITIKKTYTKITVPNDAKANTPKAARTNTGSHPKYAAIPLHTP